MEKVRTERDVARPGDSDVYASAAVCERKYLLALDASAPIKPDCFWVTGEGDTPLKIECSSGCSAGITKIHLNRICGGIYRLNHCFAVSPNRVAACPFDKSRELAR